MSGGVTPVTYPNVGPDANSALVGVAEFNRLNTSKSTANRRPEPRRKSLLARKLRILNGLRLWLPYGSRRIAVLPAFAIAGPPAGSVCRKIYVRCPFTPALLCRKPDTEMSSGRRYVPLMFPAHDQV